MCVATLQSCIKHSRATLVLVAMPSPGVAIDPPGTDLAERFADCPQFQIPPCVTRSKSFGSTSGLAQSIPLQSNNRCVRCLIGRCGHRVWQVALNVAEPENAGSALVGCVFSSRVVDGIESGGFVCEELFCCLVQLRMIKDH